VDDDGTCGYITKLKAKKQNKTLAERAKGLLLVQEFSFWFLPATDLLMTK
jgi:hypothetical protein